ncbi:hypothetical protein CXY01_01530 [Cellulomonas xylanilytica]|uniref:Uncharacterized protein n=1 Tax=Cellulomonas xylanilytica TaxID=233583 RepID=A0A510UY83_9CELL|nr:hypothetical protein CXY01_01530 [Cellulomonas xylanilytica]
MRLHRLRPDSKRTLQGADVGTLTIRRKCRRRHMCPSGHMHASAVETLDTYSHLWPDSDSRTREAVDAAMTRNVLRTNRGLAT